LPLALWWKRYRPSKSTLPTALLATLLCSGGMLAVWVPANTTDLEIARYGETLARTLASTSAGHLLHKDRIELAVIANNTTAYTEVSGLIFYNTNNEIIAMSGSSETGEHFPAPATLGDTITGYVSVVLNSQAFEPASQLWRWLATFMLLFIAPAATVVILQISTRGNRSLPIVSVPEAKAFEPQQSFFLTVNLHNQFALNAQARQQAVEDALSMAREVCAIHHGIAVEAPSKGVLLMLDRRSVSAAQAVCASMLMQRLLEQFETVGRFRCYLSEVASPDSPVEINTFGFAELSEIVDIDTHMTLAALSKSHTVLLAEVVYKGLANNEQAWAEPFTHPLLDDLDGAESLYLVKELPAQQQQLVDSQGTLILDFNQAAG